MIFEGADGRLVEAPTWFIARSYLACDAKLLDVRSSAQTVAELRYVGSDARVRSDLHLEVRERKGAEPWGDWRRWP